MSPPLHDYAADSHLVHWPGCLTLVVMTCPMSLLGRYASVRRPSSYRWDGSLDAGGMPCGPRARPSQPRATCPHPARSTHRFGSHLGRSQLYRRDLPVSGQPRTGDRRPQSPDHRRRVHGPGRAFRIRQVDGPSHARRTRTGNHRRDPHRRQGRVRQGAQGTRHRDGVPELRAVPAHVGGREHGLRAQTRRRFRRPTAPQGTRGRAASRSREVPRPATPKPCPAGSASALRWGGQSSASRASS